MPYPKKNETKEEFISRFMSNKKMISKYPNQKQRYKVALVHWEMK